MLHSAHVPTRRIGKLLREKRGKRGIREVAREIGIAPASLSRIEHGTLPDLASFQKICRWLDADANELLDLDRRNTGEIPARSTNDVADFLEALAELLRRLPGR